MFTRGTLGTAAEQTTATANNLLSAAADAPELPHTEKVQGFKNKILDGDFRTSIPRATIPLISGTEVRAALSKASNQAANAIDGWSKTLLEQAINIIDDIAVQIGEVLHWILTADMSHLLRQILTCSRGVAIAKPDGGIRPICVSSIFIKLAGSIAATRDGRLPSATQYAIGQKDGARRIIHKVRHFTETSDDWAVIKFDISNAYGSLPRRFIELCLSSADPTLRQYFRFVCGSPSPIALFGPDDTSFVSLGEGVKQGDATSSLIYCLTQDIALTDIQTTLNAHQIPFDPYSFMDDLTICCKSCDVDFIVTTVTTAFLSIGLTINADKSRILTPTASTFSIPSSPITDPFIVLGTNISPAPMAYTKFVSKLIERQKTYFDLFLRTSLHPHVKATLLRLCGHPRILYHCATTPPAHMAPVAKYFDRRVHKMVELLIDPSGDTMVPLSAIHDDGGAGAPSYSAHLNEIYGAYRTMALEHNPATPRLQLTTRAETTASAAQVDSQWLFFEATNYLTPHQFAIAFAIRLGVLPNYARLHDTKCNCGYVYTREHNTTIDHVLTCDMATHVTHTTRHNMVRDAIIQTARYYGVTTTKEPTCFTYADGRHHRPDAMFHTLPNNLVIDVSLVSTHPAQESITNAEQQKFNTHLEATRCQSCVFFPFVMATRGTLGTQAEKFIRTLIKTVQPHMQYYFRRSLAHAVASAAARGRADAISAAAMRTRW